jgi:hypothetical protein
MASRQGGFPEVRDTGSGIAGGVRLPKDKVYEVAQSVIFLLICICSMGDSLG